jgi:hypothetical protein
MELRSRRSVEGPLSRRFVETFRVLVRYDTLRRPSLQIAEVTNVLVLSRLHRRHRLGLSHAAEYRHNKPFQEASWLDLVV